MRRERDTHAELFAEYVIEAMGRTRLRQTEIARRAGLSRTTISQIVGKKPHSLTGKLLLPERETVDRIAKAFGDPLWKARRAAGYAGGGEMEETPDAQAKERQAQAERMAEMVKGFGQMTPEQQAQLIAIMHILRSEHPDLIEMLKPPIEIIDEADLLKQRPGADVEPVDT